MYFSKYNKQTKNQHNLFLTCPLRCFITWIKHAGISQNNSHRILVPFLLRIVRLPATSRKDVLVLLIPASQHHFTCMRLWGRAKGYEDQSGQHRPAFNRLQSKWVSIMGGLQWDNPNPPGWIFYHRFSKFSVIDRYNWLCSDCTGWGSVATNIKS